MKIEYARISSRSASGFCNDTSVVSLLGGAEQADIRAAMATKTSVR
jgi:hypothetical protein